MADRTSAGLAAEVFEILAKNPDDRAKEIAAKLWPKLKQYDFSNDQMGCDAALKSLGLAKEVAAIRADLGTEPEPGETWLLYKGDKGFDKRKAVE